MEKALLRRRLKVLGDQEGDLDTANSKELSSSLSNSKELSSARVIKRRRPLHKHQLNSVHPDAKELSTRKALKLLKNAIAQVRIGSCKLSSLTNSKLFVFLFFSYLILPNSTTR